MSIISTSLPYFSMLARKLLFFLQTTTSTHCQEQENMIFAHKNQRHTERDLYAAL